MNRYKINKTYQEINAKIRKGEVVVMTAEEIIDVVKTDGPVEAARRVDVVTTGTFAPMCSSGAFINFGHSKPGIKAAKVWLNNVPAYGGVAAVDCYLGATEPCEDDPLNKVYPGEFNYGGGHVIEDLVAGRALHLKATAYGTDCYPGKHLEKEVVLADLPFASLCNPRNGSQYYNCAVNLGEKTIYTYMGTLKPRANNANYCSAGQLSPLMNDPFYLTIGLGTRIFLAGGTGYVTWYGTQHNPDVPRTDGGVPEKPAGTLFVMGDLKHMDTRWLKGVSIKGYGCSLAIGLGIPIPMLNEKIAGYVGVSDKEIYTQVIDYGHDYPQGIARSLGKVSYAELKSGTIALQGREIQTVPLSSMVKAREIAGILKAEIQAARFIIGEPQMPLPGRQS